MYSMRVEEIQIVAADVLVPPPDLTVSEWADQNRRLSSESAAEKGEWRTDRAPYQRAIMDALSPNHPAETVVIMSAAQMGKSSMLENFVGYIIDLDPGPVLMVQPRELDAEAFSKDRLAPMFRDTPILREKVSEARSRDSRNTILHKKFLGGTITLSAANSPAGLAMRSIRYCLLDEIDRYPASAGAEGDPVNLAITRTANFWNRKIVMCSTPTVRGLSRIEAAWLESDQRSFWVPCPHCGERQVLRWERLTWPEGNPRKAYYRGEHCDHEIHDWQKHHMLKHGEWRAANPESSTVGFWINALYSPWRKWGELADKFVKAQRSQETLREFVNTVLAEPWVESGEVPDWQRLYERRESYDLGTVPVGGLILTAGADVQKDRIEIQVVAWGEGKESWLVDYVVLDGDTAAPAVWRKLTDWTSATYPHANGANLQIQRLAIDSGFGTQHVYNWARQQAPGRVLVIKGVEYAAAAVGLPTGVDVTHIGKKLPRGVRVWPISTGTLKGELYGWLRLPAPLDGEPYPPGYCHFPQVGDEFFKQLTAEQLVTKVTKGGYRKQEWQKIRERNETLDTRIYARAAAIVFGIDRFGERQWAQLREQVGATRVSVAAQPAAPEPAPTPSPRRDQQWLTRPRRWLRKMKKS
jgi:phage terminase large subunit GpA-like protein